MSTAGDVATWVGGRVVGSADRRVSGVASPERAGPDDLAFASSLKVLAEVLAGRAGTVLVSAVSALPADRTAVVVPDPRLAFARAAARLIPKTSPAPGVHPSAVVAASVQLGPGVSVAAHAVIEDGVTVGEGCVIGAGVVLGAGSSLGARTRLHPRVVLYDGVRLGSDCVVHAGTVLGSDGFGFVPTPQGHHKMPQLGGLTVGDDVEIGANCTIDRGALTDTVIGTGTRIDNLVHIAHGAHVGERCLIAGQSGLAGSVRLGENVHLAGQVGVDQGARLGDGVQLGSRTWVRAGQRIDDGVWLGQPAAPIAQALRQIAVVRQLPTVMREWRAGLDSRPPGQANDAPAAGGAEEGDEGRDD